MNLLQHLRTEKLPQEAATKRKNIHSGLYVAVVLKEDQATGKLTEGYVRHILTKSKMHQRGIKVCLESGQIGRVQKILMEK